MDKTKLLNINEIFYSIQGEGSRAGKPCIFIRLQGCRLRCTWCDTPYALELKEEVNLMTLAELEEKVKFYNCKFVEFTGGEPLEQENIYELMEYLCDNNYEVAIETSGYILLDRVDSRVIKIMDVKCPASKMHTKNKYENFNFLNKKDEIKFVIADRNDYEFAKDIISKYNLNDISENILFSPSFHDQDYKKLAEWILEDNLQVRMQLQLHKFIWSPEMRGV